MDNVSSGRPSQTKTLLRSHLWLFRLLFCLSLSLSFCVSAASDDAFNLPAAHIDPAIESLNLAPYVSRLPADAAVNSPEEAYLHWTQGNFLNKHFQQRITTSFSNRSQWLAFRLRSHDLTRSLPERIVSTQDVMHLTRLMLYIPVIENGVATYLALPDSLHAIDQPPMGTPISSFKLPADFDAARPFFLRADGKLPLNSPLLLQSTRAAYWESAVRIALSALLFGSVLGLILYNFVLFFFMRDSAYLLYVAYAASMLLWLMQISGFMLFLDRGVGLAYYHLITPNFSAALANLLGSIFTVVFLRLHQQNRWLGVTVMFIAAANLAVGIITLWIEDKEVYIFLHKLQYAIACLSALAVIISTGLLTMKGHRFALPFICAWSSLGAGIWLLAIGHRPVYFGVPFPPGFNVLAAMALEMVLMSYALGLRFKDVSREANQLAQLSITDGLTNLYNQRYFHDQIHSLTLRSHANAPDWACVMIDIDHFKSFNDNHGHLLGDRVLKELSRIIQKNVRQQDFAFRAGGEEFALLLKTPSQEEALKVAERIRESFENTAITSDEGENLSCSLSAGITLLRPSDNPDDFIGRADKALYSAKRGGRNCIRVDPEMA